MADVPEKVITLAELRRSTGERGTRMLVACEGIVYDVTDCPRWRRGLHENQHFPGQDLSEELSKEAPHSTEVFNNPCVKIVGHLGD